MALFGLPLPSHPSPPSPHVQPIEAFLLPAERAPGAREWRSARSAPSAPGRGEPKPRAAALAGARAETKMGVVVKTVLGSHFGVGGFTTH